MVFTVFSTSIDTKYILVGGGKSFKLISYKK